MLALVIVLVCLVIPPSGTSLAHNESVMARKEFQPGNPVNYTFHVNLDERGSFYADVRNSNGKTVYELKADGEELEQVVDGFMKHRTDIDGLGEYLHDLGFMPKNATLVKGD